MAGAGPQSPASERVVWATTAWRLVAGGVAGAIEEVWRDNSSRAGGAETLGTQWRGYGGARPGGGNINSRRKAGGSGEAGGIGVKAAGAAATAGMEKYCFFISCTLSPTQHPGYLA